MAIGNEHKANEHLIGDRLHLLMCVTVTSSGSSSSVCCLFTWLGSSRQLPVPEGLNSKVLATLFLARLSEKLIDKQLDVFQVSRLSPKLPSPS
jgi:hypothetical protein